jgi:hypothetical protein
VGELQRVSVQRSAAQPAARVRDTSTRARPAEREPVARPLQRMMALRALQPQLAVGAVDDPFEREAERTADTVTSTGQPASSALGVRPLAASLLRVAQRAMGKGETAAKKDDDDKTRKVQKKPSASTGPEIVPRGVESQIQVMSAGGDPLAPSLRSRFEPRFGYDFSSVRTHTGSDAAGAAVALGARAFTVGDHIFFGAGEYQPSSASGQRLIAHELTHTIQQKPAAPRVQRDWLDDLKAAALERVRGWASELPPYELLTVLLGRDPITQQVVERSGGNIIHAALRLVPNGQQIFDDMRQSGSLDRAAAWFDAEIARLNLTWQGIRALFTQAWNAISGTDFLQPSVVWERIRGIFGPTLQRIGDFAAAVGRRLLDFIKEQVLQRLRAWAQGIPGYRLLTFVLGRDPFTDEPVPRTAVTFVRAVLDLVPGGEQIFQNLERTRTIERTMEWLRGEIARLDLTWDAIKGLFLRAWNAFTVADLLHPIALIERISAIFADPARRVVRFAAAVGRKVLEFIFEGAMALAGPLGQQVVRIFRRAGQVFDQIVADPVRFIHNLVNALIRGFSQFRDNILTHMRTALAQWLFSALEGAGLQLPEQWNLQGILSLVLQILGITWQRIRQKIVRIIGEDRMQALERVFDFVQDLITRGPIVLWERIVEAFDNLQETVFGGIREWAITRIVRAAVTRLLTLFNPAGAIIQAIISTYETIKFFVEKIQQIADTVEAIVESIARIAAGVLGPAANAVERAMARTLPVVLDFLARLIGLGDVSGQIRRVIEGLQQRVDRALDRAVDWVIERGRALLERGRAAVARVREWWQMRMGFRDPEGESHSLYFEGEGGGAALVVSSTPQPVARYFAAWQSAINAIRNDPTRSAEQDRALADARAKNGSIQVLQRELAAPVPRGTQEAGRQEKVARLSTQLGELAALLALRDVGSRAPLPPPILPAFANGVLARGFTAEYINKNIPTGTASGSHTGALQGWDYIQQNNLSARSAWVKMHLLPAPLGGDAVDSNLVPARGPQTNIRFANAVEHQARAALDAPVPDREQMIWYTVSVGFHRSPFAGFPDDISVQWGGYDLTGTRWAKRSRASGRLSSREDPPSPGEDAVLRINREGRVRIAAVTGVDDYFARLIIELKPTSDYTDIGDLVGRLSSYESRKAGRNLIPDFSSKVRRLTVADAAGRIRFN